MHSNICAVDDLCPAWAGSRDHVLFVDLNIRLAFSAFPALIRSLDVIKKLGYAGPTPIQAQAIPAIMSGRDVIGVAKTGSGKTIAFLLPLFRHIKDQRPLEQMEGPLAIVMTPTRELATQIHRDCKPFLRVLNLRVSMILAFMGIC